ncbi:MAG: hypothetical protein V4674_01075 [Patescibacteria group bacterium]
MVRIAVLISILVLCTSVTPADGAVRKRSKKVKVAHERAPEVNDSLEEPVDEAFEEIRESIAPDPLPELGEGEGPEQRLSALSDYLVRSLSQVAGTLAYELVAIASDTLAPATENNDVSEEEEPSTEEGQETRGQSLASIRFATCEFKRWYEL